METLIELDSVMPMSTAQSQAPTLHQPDPEAIATAIHKRTFCNLATTSPAGRPHVVGVVYNTVDDALYVSTHRDSRKGRNIAANPRVAVTIPVRRIPFGPPSTISFQTEAELLGVDNTHITELATAGRLDTITGHGELESPGTCFLRIPIPRRVLTYGLGMPLLGFIRDPLNAAGVVELDPSA